MSSALWQAFAAVAARSPRRRVLVAAESGETWTAPRLLARAAACAEEGNLARARGGCVAFCQPNGAGWMATFLATQVAGVTALPLDPGSAAGEWTDAAAALGATHALRGGELVTLRRGGGDVDWRRFAVGKTTSGSTGAPTVVPCRASHLLADGANITRTMGIRPTDRNLAILPLGHSYGLGNLVMPLVLQGTGVVTAAGYVPRQILAWIGEHRVTVLPAVPVILQILTGVDDARPLPSLRLVISAGAPLPAGTAAGFFARFGVRVRNFYGSSETGGICFDADGEASLTGRAVGRPMHGVEVTVGRGGRIRVESAAVAMPRGRCSLADIGRWNEAGELQITGRAGAIANIGGRKVNPTEVETALREIPGVTAAWVTVSRQGTRDHLAAAVESGRPHAEIRAELAARLARWKQPRALVVAAALPRNARGKLDAAALRELLGTSKDVRG